MRLRQFLRTLLAWLSRRPAVPHFDLTNFVPETKASPHAHALMTLHEIGE